MTWAEIETFSIHGCTLEVHRPLTAGGHHLHITGDLLQDLIQDLHHRTGLLDPLIQATVLRHLVGVLHHLHQACLTIFRHLDLPLASKMSLLRLEERGGGNAGGAWQRAQAALSPGAAENDECAALLREKRDLVEIS